MYSTCSRCNLPSLPLETFFYDLDDDDDVVLDDEL